MGEFFLFSQSGCTNNYNLKSRKAATGRERPTSIQVLFEAAFWRNQAGFVKTVVRFQLSLMSP